MMKHMFLGEQRNPHVDIQQMTHGWLVLIHQRIHLLAGQSPTRPTPKLAEFAGGGFPVLNLDTGPSVNQRGHDLTERQLLPPGKLSGSDDRCFIKHQCGSSHGVTSHQFDELTLTRGNEDSVGNADVGAVEAVGVFHPGQVLVGPIPGPLEVIGHPDDAEDPAA